MNASLVNTLLYQTTPEGVVTPQPIFNDFAITLWQDEKLAPYRVYLIPASIRETADQPDSATRFAAVMAPYTFYNDAAKAAFKNWWVSNCNHAELLPDIRHRELNLLIAGSVIRLCSDAGNAFANVFFNEILNKVGLFYTSLLFLDISNFPILHFALELNYFYKKDAVENKNNMINILHDMMKASELETRNSEETSSSVAHTELTRPQIQAAAFNFVVMPGKTFSAECHLRILSLFLIEDVSPSFVDVVSSHMDRLCLLLREYEDNYHRGMAQFTDALKVIEKIWGWLIDHVSSERWQSILNPSEAGSSEPYVFSLIKQACERGLSIILGAMSSHLKEPEYGHMLMRSMAPDTYIRFFNMVLPFTDLRLFTQSQPLKYMGSDERPLVFAIKQGERGLTYLKSMFDHLRVLQGEMDLTTKPSEEIIRLFICGAFKEQNLLWQAISHQNVDVTLWLLDLANPIWHDVLTMSVWSRFSDQIQADPERMFPVNKRLLEGGERFCISKHGVGQSNIWYCSSDIRTFFRFLQSYTEGSLSRLTTREIQAHLHQMEQIRDSWLAMTFIAEMYEASVASKKSGKPISPHTILAVDKALTRELVLRNQPLSTMIRSIAPSTRLRQTLMQTPGFRQTVEALLSKPGIVSQEAALALRGILNDSLQPLKDVDDASPMTPEPTTAFPSSGLVPQFLRLARVVLSQASQQTPSIEIPGVSVSQQSDLYPPIYSGSPGSSNFYGGGQGSAASSSSALGAPASSSSSFNAPSHR